MLPERFGAIQDVRAHCHIFFPWSRYAGDSITRMISDLCVVISDHPHMYNVEHHHSGLGLLTPHDVQFGLAEQGVAARATVLAAYAAHPERFPRGLPQPPVCPTEFWINAPNTLGRLHAASRTRPSDLPTRAPSRSLPSVAALSERL